MGTTSIIGLDVAVEKQRTDAVDVYTVSGPEAEILHALCEHHKLAVSPFTDGRFTISQATIDNERAAADSHTRLYICNSVVEIAQAQLVARP